MSCDCSWSCKYGDVRTIRATLQGTEGEPVDLTGIPSVQIRIRAKTPASATVLEADCTVEDVAGGVVAYELDTTDLAGPGVYLVEWVVVAGQGPITFPSVGQEEIRVEKPL